jgi:hypothetical protein
MNYVRDQVARGFAGLFFVACIVLGIAIVLVFFLSQDAVFKRRWFPRLIILYGILIVGLSIAVFSQPSGLAAGLRMQVIVVPIMVWFCRWTITHTKFCGQCGTMVRTGYRFVSREFCSRCGAALDEKPKHRDDWAA